jgi:hypothetical protein
MRLKLSNSYIGISGAIAAFGFVLALLAGMMSPTQFYIFHYIPVGVIEWSLLIISALASVYTVICLFGILRRASCSVTSSAFAILGAGVPVCFILFLAVMSLSFSR